MADLLRSGAFRFAIMLCTIFAIGTAALLFKVERSVTGYATEVASDSVSAEIATLRDEDKLAGRPKMIRSIMVRERAVREHQLRYLLVDGQGRRLAGDIPAKAAQVGWYTLTLAPLDHGDEDGAAQVSLKALGERLPDGDILVVGSDTSDQEDLRLSLRKSTIAFGVGISLFALLGGLAVGTLFLRRLDRVNQAVGRIMEGSLAERLPAIGMGSEFDALSTNLNRMLERIEALMTGMRQISTDIAHDLRTPLTRLRQRLETLRESFEKQEKISEAQIDAAIAQTDSILAIFHALLRISSLEAGAGKQRFSQVDLSEIMARVYQAFLPVAEDSRHGLSAEIEPAVSVRGDAELLAQAVTNLIENALVHTPVGSHITLALKRVIGGVSLIVADDGPGIPEGERAQVLHRFYRLDRSRNSPGAGLGLALVLSIAAIHEAKLSLDDNGPGLRVEMIFDDPAKP